MSYVNSDICILLYVCGLPSSGHIYVICFSLRYKLSTSVSSVEVLKKTSETFRIQHDQRNSKSPFDVGFES